MQGLRYRMKKCAIVAGWGAIFLINTWYLYNSAEYFSKNFGNLTYVFAIAFAGGIAFYIYHLLPPCLQNKVLLFLLGTCVVFTSGFFLWFSIKFIGIFRDPLMHARDSLSDYVMFAPVVLLFISVIVCGCLLFCWVLGAYQKKNESDD